jgi:lipid II:glycine glycyltransferase (peptidoglycan interpeptide bridge formation enzyme)
MFGKMTSACRRNIRHAEKLGLRIEEAGDLDFADEFAAQFKDVFAKQGMVPHFGADRIRAMIRNVHPTGMLLLLRARDPEGRCIATGIYPAMHETAFYNNGASWRQYQKLRPNESLHWYAMRYWKRKGMRRYNMEGFMSFKQKFGGQRTDVPMIYKSKYRLLERLRSSAIPMGRAVLGLAWKLKALGKRKPAEEPAEEA